MQMLYLTLRARIFHKAGLYLVVFKQLRHFYVRLTPATPKTAAQKSQKVGIKMCVSAPLQTIGLVVQFDTHCCGREAVPYLKKKRGNVEEPPHKKTREGSKGTPRRVFFCVSGWLTLNPMDVESKVRLATELPPSMATNHVRQRNARKKGRNSSEYWLHG